jgi:hypothetical protein
MPDYCSNKDHLRSENEVLKIPVNEKKEIPGRGVVNFPDDKTMEFPSFTWVNSYVIGVCIAVNQWVSSI